ncbi:hypothetical protein EDC04DRAFT_2824665 [Pisolithus marmoratus]|nr:hypothetical protein EDC04DRAFT_2824665 [Pisolithus marmoratus]
MPIESPPSSSLSPHAPASVRDHLEMVERELLSLKVTETPSSPTRALVREPHAPMVRPSQIRQLARASRKPPSTSHVPPAASSHVRLFSQIPRLVSARSRVPPWDDGTPVPYGYSAEPKTCPHPPLLSPGSPQPRSGSPSQSRRSTLSVLCSILHALVQILAE